MTEHDESVSRRYAALAREEPGAALDAAILAASRRPLVRDSWSRRWAAPVSIAAVLVLALGVTLRMQQEQPGIERADAPRPAPTPPAPEQAAPQSPKVQAPPPEPLAKSRSPEAQPRAKLSSGSRAPAVADRLAAKPEANEALPMKEKQGFAEPKPFPDAAAPRAREEAAPSREKKDALANLAPAPAPAAAPAAAPPAPAGAPAAPAREVAQSSTLRMQSAVIRSEEEVELERIAKLRVEGKHEEADKALAEFRRRHPDYKIPDAIWERVRAR